MCSEKLLTCLRAHSKKVAELNSSSGLLTPLIRWMKPGPDCLSSPTLYSWPLLACPVPGSWSQNHTLPISWDSSSSYMISNSLSNCPYKSASVISVFPHLNLVSQTVYCSWKWLKNSFRLSVLTWSLDNTCTPRAGGSSPTCNNQITWLSNRQPRGGCTARSHTCPLTS